MLFFLVRKNKEQIYLLNRKCKEIEIKPQNKTVSFYLGRLTKAIPLFFLST